MLMYDGRAEARTREQENWKGLIYQKWKGENWDRDMKTRLEFKRTKNGMMKTDEDRNVIGVLGGCLEFSESDDNTLEVLGGSRSLGVWLA